MTNDVEKLPCAINDPPVTISRKLIIIVGTTIFIFERSGSNEDESGDHFIKTITIAGNQKRIFAKTKNDFAEEKNQNYLSGNRSCGNILQDDGNKLKNQIIILLEAGNVLKKDSINIIIPGNKLKELGRIVQNAGNKLKKDESNLKNLGNGLIFVETFREN